MNRLLFLISIFAIGSAKSQTTLRNVSGVVKAAEEMTPLEGVTVVIKGTKKISGTQPDGAFYIEVENRDTIFVFSLVGFETKEVRITEANDYPVILTKATPSILMTTKYERLNSIKGFANSEYCLSNN